MKTKILTLLTTFAISSVSMAQIINVPGDQPTIQAGIDAATDGDTVLVDTDTYYENINFNGKAITVASNYIIEGDTNFINNTTIDGSQPVNPDNGSVVTFNSGEDSTSLICGFTITGGTGTYISSIDQQYGGGIYCNYAGAKIIHNKIINNTCEYANQASGGGIGCRFGSSWIVIRNNTVRDNVVSSDNDALGGGIYSRYNSQIITNNIISHDSLSGYNTFGGAVCISFTYYTEMTGNIITRNKVNHTYVYWTGVYFYKPIGPVNILQNEFSYHEGDFTGDAAGVLGFYKANEYPVLVDGNRFLHNSALVGGAFCEVNSYNLQLTNNVFIGNDAYQGGAIRIYHQENSNEYRPQIINNTFFDNSANGFGGAISYYADPGITGSSPVIINSIFWENSAPPGGGIDIDNWSSDTIFVYYSDIDYYLISGQWLGGFNFLADPELEEDNIHLLGSSPCINMGTNTLEINGATYLCPDHDIDGDPRPLYDVADVGADEYDLPVGIVSMDITLDGPSIEIFPNPFTVSADIKFNLQSSGQVELSLYDFSGRKVRALINNNLQAGFHEVKLNSSDLKSGIYFCVLISDKGIQSKKLIKTE